VSQSSRAAPRGRTAPHLLRVLVFSFWVSKNEPIFFAQPLHRKDRNLQNIQWKQETAVGPRIVPAERVVDGILVNPQNPPADADHADRDIEELLIWWRLPYIVTHNGEYHVHVLNDGAHDRTHFLGRYDTAEAAAAAAKRFYNEARVVAVMK